MENKLFWKTMKPFVTNKSGVSNDNITIVDNERLITDDKELARILIHHPVSGPGPRPVKSGPQKVGPHKTP